MRLRITLFALMLTAGIVQAQTAAIPGGNGTQCDVTLISESAQGIDLRFTLEGYTSTAINTSLGSAIIPSFTGSARMLFKDAPDLPHFARSIIVNSEVELEVLSTSYYDIPNVLIAPSKGNLTRNIDPNSLPFVFGTVYTKDAFFPGQAAVMGSVYTFRDYSGCAVDFQPLQYNPVTKVLRVHTQIDVRVKSKFPSLINAPVISRPVVSDFHNTYERHFLNYSASKYTALGEVGSMLVISYPAFMASMQSFVDWKIMRGMPTEMVSVTTAGTTAAAIKSYIQNYYNTHPNLVFVLLVGDAAQVPTNTVTAGHSDNAYGYLLGNDSYPELIIGRFSAENVGHVNTLVERSVSYERSPTITGSWLTHNIGIGSDQGPGDDSEMDYEHIRNMQTDLINYHFNTSSEFFDGSQGGLDGAGSPTPAQVATAINAGAGVITYCGHGSNTSWGTSGFSNTNITTSLTNVYKLPFIFSVACVNGNFVGNTCFAEAWTRATISDAPIGAVAALMSTINQSWNPPMDAQDEMVDILTETYSGNIRRSFGAIAMNGCMHMNDQYGSGGAEMTDTWTIFGDPSLIIRSNNPTVIAANHNPVMPLGSSQFVVNANVNGAKAVLSSGSQIIAVADVVGGIASLSFLPLTLPDTISLVVWAYNAIPYIAQVPLIPSSGPYVVFDGKQIDDAAGNGNSLADYSETINLNVSLGNVGISQADSVYAILSSTDPHVQIIDSTHFWGNILNGSSLVASGAFSVKISDAVPDQYSMPFKMSIFDKSANSWTSYFTLIGQAPMFTIGNFNWNDSQGGNNNGKPEPGEIVKLSVQTINKGHSMAKSTKASLMCLLPQVSIFDPNVSLGDVQQGDTGVATFTLSLDTGISTGTIINLAFLAKAGAYTGNATIASRLGIVSEDFETGNLTKFSWNTSGTALWAANGSSPFEGNFSARSGIVNHSQNSQLSITMSVNSPDSISFWKKVSCEDGSSSGQKWDFLEFFIDNVSMGWWDGEVAWSRNAYAVAPGTHTFKWLYAKDGYVSAGSDCSWIDYVVFPMQGASTGWKSYPYLAAKGITFTPAVGNGNSYAEPGETFYVDLKVLNLGQALASGIKVVLKSPDPDVIVYDSVQVLGAIFGKDSLSVISGLTLAVNPSLVVDKEISLLLRLDWDTSKTSYLTIPLKLYGASTGISESGTKALRIWPNPASDYINIELPEWVGNDAVLHLIDVSGKELNLIMPIQNPIPGQILQIALPGQLSTGVYVLKLISGEANHSSTLLINRK